MMLDKYKRQILPNKRRDEDLRHLAESYEMKMRKGEYLRNEESRVSEDLCQRQTDHRLEMRRITTSADLHADSIKRGEILLRDLDKDAKH